MKTKHLKKRVAYFKALSGLSKKDIKQYMVECPESLIHVICEACYNLCHHPKLKRVLKMKGCLFLQSLWVHVGSLIRVSNVLILVSDL